MPNVSNRIAEYFVQQLNTDKPKSRSFVGRTVVTANTDLVALMYRGEYVAIAQRGGGELTITVPSALDSLCLQRMNALLFALLLPNTTNFAQVVVDNGTPTLYVRDAGLPMRYELGAGEAYRIAFRDTETNDMVSQVS